MIAVTSVGVMISVCLIFIGIYCNKANWFDILVIFYFHVHAIAVTLVYMDVLPEILQGRQEAFEF